ncbi:hypothetical protein HDV00_010814 [Rhizophlyctis rosea]|nr:hypothetical protein HDV00_010814 [Rhizophlyctis rosea]
MSSNPDPAPLAFKREDSFGAASNKSYASFASSSSLGSETSSGSGVSTESEERTGGVEYLGWEVLDRKHVIRARRLSATHKLSCECRGSGVGCQCLFSCTCH